MCWWIFHKDREVKAFEGHYWAIGAIGYECVDCGRRRVYRYQENANAKQRQVQIDWCNKVESEDSHGKTNTLD